MKRAKHLAVGILAAASVAFAASASAQPGEGGRMGHGASGPHAQGQHAAMQARMAQRMAQHQAKHQGARGQQGAGGCNMGAQGGAEGEHKH